MGQNASNSVEFANIFAYDANYFIGGSVTLGGGSVPQILVDGIGIQNLPGPGTYSILARSIPIYRDSREPVDHFYLRGYGGLPIYDLKDRSITTVTFGSNGSYGLSPFRE